MRLQYGFHLRRKHVRVVQKFEDIKLNSGRAKNQVVMGKIMDWSES